MKTALPLKAWLLAGCLLTAALPVLARVSDDEQRVPAAPEPALILMAVGGVGVVGGYVALRLHRGRKK